MEVTAPIFKANSEVSNTTEEIFYSKNRNAKNTFFHQNLQFNFKMHLKVGAEKSFVVHLKVWNKSDAPEQIKV